jgi:hypothetical protein
MVMLTDAAKSAGGTIAVRDVAEIVADRLPASQQPTGDKQLASSNSS